MSDYWTAPCPCEQCVLAHTDCVKFSPEKVLHGRPAAQFLASRQRGMVRLGEVADKIRKDLGIK